MRTAKSGGNIFQDIGFDRADAEELAAKADLVALLLRAIRLRELTQREAAEICGTDQPTLSKTLGGKLDSVTIDRLARWIVALGGQIEISVRPPRSRAGKYKGQMTVQAG